MAIVVDSETRLVVQGLTGQRGPLPRRCATATTARTSSPASRPGKGGQDVEGIPVFNTVADAVARDRREHDDDLRAGALRRATRSTRPSTRASARSSASPSASRARRCCASTRTSGRAASRLIGPNCPGVLSPGKANVGIIPAEIFSEGNDRPRLALGHAHVPDRPRADAARARQLDDRRHRRRPRRRLVVHRRPRAASRPTPRPSTS